jgi:hypothetical protein
MRIDWEGENPPGQGIGPTKIKKSTSETDWGLDLKICIEFSDYNEFGD